MITFLIIYTVIGSLYAHTMMGFLQEAPGDSKEEKEALGFLNNNAVMNFLTFGLLMFFWLPITLYVLVRPDVPKFN